VVELGLVTPEARKAWRRTVAAFLAECDDAGAPWLNGSIAAAMLQRITVRGREHA
jgi:hypothetical protein